MDCTDFHRANTDTPHVNTPSPSQSLRVSETRRFWRLDDDGIVSINVVEDDGSDLQNGKSG